MILIDLIAGARPNFMKIAPIIGAIRIKKREIKGLDYRLVHTGQHYDANMSGQFFEQLGIPDPHVNLNAGSGTQAAQTAAIMIGYEQLLMESRSDLCLVVGDVNSTLACSIVAQKMGVPVAHVEGGIRSGDWSMPEEINRLVTDAISNYFFTTSEVANANLRSSGVADQRIFFVGNTMIDTLLRQRPFFRPPICWQAYQLQPRNYLVVTLHRPSNVDHADQLAAIMRVLENEAAAMPVIFPVHPRTRKNMDQFGIRLNNVKLVDPMGYLEFNYLVQHARGVITDSGGITEETTVLGIPCMTLRNSTERPETVTLGTNELLGTDTAALQTALKKLMDGNWKRGEIPPLWDGKSAERIVGHIASLFF